MGSSTANQAANSGPADNLLAELTNDELEFIIYCVRIKQVNDKFANDTHKLNKLTQLKQRHTHTLSFDNHKISQAIYIATTDAPSLLFMVISTLGGIIVGGGTIAIGILLAALATFGLALSGIYIWLSSDSSEKNKMNKQGKIELLALRLECIQELTRRLQVKGTHFSKAALLPSFIVTSEQDDEHVSTIRRVLGVGLMMFATLICTYAAAFYTATALLGLTALASIISAPAAIAIVLVLSFAAAAYFAYKQYLIVDNEKKLEHHVEKMEAQVLEKYKEYDNYKRSDELDVLHKKIPENFINEMAKFNQQKNSPSYVKHPSPLFPNPTAIISPDPNETLENGAMALNYRLGEVG